MTEPLSPGARAALAVIEDARRLQAHRRELRELLQDNCEYLSSNSIVVFAGEERPSDSLLTAEREGDVEAGLTRSCSWVREGWLRLRTAILEMGLSEVVQNWRPPQSIWMDVHPLFVRILSLRKPGGAVRSTAASLAEMREALRENRYHLWRYFGWLRDQMETHWAAQDAAPASQRSGVSGSPASDAMPRTLAEFARERRLPEPFARGADWVSARDLARSTNVQATTLANARCSGRKTADALAGVDARERVWVKTSKNAHVLYRRERVSEAG